ncbi:MAG: hypothetical protein TREMPRED_003280, partial [Tremellales sp. Tagirdzhanova-0007]
MVCYTVGRSTYDSVIDLHDLFMILYLVLTLPWMFLATLKSTSAKSSQIRQIFALGFLSTIPFVVWTYYRHSVMKIPGAYTYYAFLEWSLIFWDVAFDAVAVFELQRIRASHFAIIDTSRSEGSHNDTNQKIGRAH